MKKPILIILVCLLYFMCKVEYKSDLVQIDKHGALVHLFLDQLNKAIVNDIFSPPVASRIYAYSFLAGNIALHPTNKSYWKHIRPDLNLPEVDLQYPYLTALLAMNKVGSELVFSKNYLDDYQDSLKQYISLNNFELEAIQTASFSANVISDWLKKNLISIDGYAETRTMDRYTMAKSDPGKWIPTPPDYLDALEPHWKKIKPLYIDSSAQFAPDPQYTFNMEEGSTFNTELKELYVFVKDSLTEEKIEIAEFWDCNPFVTEHVGHFMKGVKKITPGGHWMGINKIVSKQNNLSPAESIANYTLLATTLMDAFISCWDEKYRSNLIRPETLINLHIDPEWKPILVTPSFPEYPSGHSVASGAAATILTYIYGNEVEYIDDTEVLFGLPVRSYTSFEQAANEAAISRYYGGIHYKPAIFDGLTQGKDIGQYVINKIEK